MDAIVADIRKKQLVANFGPARGAQGPEGGGIGWLYSSTTADADPGSGNLRLNNAAVASATFLYIDNADVTGASMTGWMDTWDDSNSTIRGQVVLREQGTGKTVIFNVTGAVIDGTGYRKIPVAYLSGAGGFTNTNRLLVSFSAAGNTGDVPGTRTVTGGGLAPAGNGGPLSANVVVNITEASDSEARAMLSGAVAMSPRRTAASIDTFLDILERTMIRDPLLTLGQATADARRGVEMLAARSAGAVRYRVGLLASTVLTDVATVVRATSALARSQAGSYASFLAGVPRTTTAGLHVSEARTNLVLYSNDNTQAAWAKSQTTITGAAISAAGLPMDLATESGTVAALRTTAALAVVAASTYAVAAILKRGNCDWHCIRIGDDAAMTNAALVYVNLATGALGTPGVVGTGFGYQSATIEPLADGAYRVMIIVIPPVTTMFVRFGTATASGDASRPDIGGGGGIGTTYYLGNVDATAGAFASAPIITGAATVTRNTEVISEAVNIPVGQSFTIIGKFVAPAAGAVAGFPHVATLHDVSQDNMMRVHVTSGNLFTVIGNTAGISFSAGTLATVVPGQTYGFACSVVGNTITTSVNGAATTAYTMPGGALAAVLTALKLGCNQNGGQPLNSTLRDLNITMRAYSNAELQTASDVSLTHSLDFTTQSYNYVGDPYLAVADLPMTTFTRATTALVKNLAGRYLAVSAGMLRLSDAGLTLGPTRTNLILNSDDRSAATWTRQASVIVTDSVSAAGLLLDLVTEAANTARVYLSAPITIANATAYSASCILKRGNSDWVTVRVSDDVASTNSIAIWVNLATGAIGTVNTSGTGFGYSSSYLEALADSTYRLNIAFTSPTTTLGFRTNSAGADASNTRADIGGGPGIGSTYYTGNVDVTAGAFPVTPIVTAAASVTQNGDDFVSVEPAPTGSSTIFCDFYMPAVLPADSQTYVFQWDDGTTANRIAVVLSTTGALSVSVNIASVAQCSLAMGSPALGSRVKLAMRIAANDFSASLNGGAVVTDTSGALPVCNYFRYGRANPSLNVANFWRGSIKKVDRYNVGKIDGQLQAMAA